ncbi:hypothetical protein NM688_g8141 [Phlebia brevispora]|uniref:Uncharacterized protein n=1 Tax=Phlebia brevispora TaxID=194682 RepID=A0ACC1RWS2_9APHY|nr:hypothetical protein NM688_g8141 [Phlebia brevispora]
MKHFNVDSVQITVEELELLCTAFVSLESLHCSIGWCNGSDLWGEAIATAHNLRSLRLNIAFRQGLSGKLIDADIARRWMLRENSRLRYIAVGRDMFKGLWVLRKSAGGETHPEFAVERCREQDTWI